jgi:hypothetical protein
MMGTRFEGTAALTCVRWNLALHVPEPHSGQSLPVTSALRSVEIL